MSFHGMPKRTQALGDPYFDECMETARLVAARAGVAAGKLVVTFQSRLGRAEWLQPYTEPTLVQMARQGVKSVDVMCPGFVADNLETLEEINQEARAAYLKAGGMEFNYVPCLNDQHEWISALSALTLQHLQGWDTRALQSPANA
jgi:ferrochelatase